MKKLLIKIEYQGLKIEYTPTPTTKNFYQKLHEIILDFNDLDWDYIDDDGVNFIKSKHPEIKYINEDFAPSDIAFMLDAMINWDHEVFSTSYVVNNIWPIEFG